MSGRGEGASFAVVWQEPDGVAAGKLVLGRDCLLLTGRARDGRVAARELPYAEIAGVRIGRAAGERLKGGATLILARRSGTLLRIGTLGAGLLFELAELLALLTNEDADGLERVVLVAPLRTGKLERARDVIDQGPPFEPAEAGLERHDVFLTGAEVVFLFEGSGAGEALRRLASDPGLWRAAAAWGACLAGRPRLAELRYSWSRPPREPAQQPEAAVLRSKRVELS